MIKVAGKIERHLQRIVTWFAHPISNGSAEGDNRMIQALKSASRGFRNCEKDRPRILFFGGKHQLQPHPPN